MDPDFSYDPVTAIDEASATGETAGTFADIRRTLGIPLVTSIWRGLAGVDQGLRQVWALARPIYLSGLPEHALARVVADTELPLPEPLPPPLPACAGLTPVDLRDIRAIVAAYNRSNGLNLVALAALVSSPAPQAADDAPGNCTPEWPPLRPLQPRVAIDDVTWSLVRHVNAFGALDIEAGVATLWRHLAHWPGLLALVHCGFAPLQARGAVAAASSRMVALALEQGARMAHLRPSELGLSAQAHDTVTGYVNNPAKVARMVVLGHALACWLEPHVKSS